jgi:hypothetical protein
MLIYALNLKVQNIKVVVHSEYQHADFGFEKCFFFINHVYKKYQYFSFTELPYFHVWY